jgi:hypothetical protein
MSLPLLLIDMMGQRKENAACTLAGQIQGERQDTYIIREKFFLQRVNGRVAPALVERAIDYLQGEIAEGFQGEWSLEDFIIVLAVLATAQPDFCLQVAEELAERTRKQPHIVTVQLQEGKPQIVAVPLLPCRWWCTEGDTVILAQDVWLVEQAEEEPPAWPRGQPFVIVRTNVATQEGTARPCLLTMAYLAQEHAPVSLVLPWELVVHPSAWQDAPPQEEHRRAVATFQLPSWYYVRFEELEKQDHGTASDYLYPC